MQKTRSAGSRVRLLLLAPFALAGCDGGTSIPTPAAVEASSVVAQQAAPGAEVPEAPAVRVLDRQGRGIRGVAVAFTVTSGGGSVGVPQATTDATGVATAGTWTLGAGEGTNTVTATVSGLAPVTFTALGRDPCRIVVALAPLATRQGSLAAGDCQLEDGSYAHFYSVAVAAARGLTFTMTSTAVDAYLALLDAGNNLVGVNDDGSATSFNAALRIFLPAGDYTLAATSYYPRETGSYTVGSTELTAVANCDDTFVVPGVQLTGEITAADCDFGGYYSDDVLVMLREGERIEIRMSSAQVDPYLAVWTADGLVAEDDDGGGGTTALLDFTAPETRLYAIEVGTAVPGTTGTYTLSVTRVAAAAAARSLEAGSEVQRALRARAEKGAGPLRPRDAARPR